MILMASYRKTWTMPQKRSIRSFKRWTWWESSVRLWHRRSSQEQARSRLTLFTTSLQHNWDALLHTYWTHRPTSSSASGQMKSGNPSNLTQNMFTASSWPRASLSLSRFILLDTNSATVSNHLSISFGHWPSKNEISTRKNKSILSICLGRLKTT